MKTTQTEKVLQYLKEHKVANTNELRRALFIVDVPKAVSILVDKGYRISAKRNKDNTATYTYEGASTPILTPKKWIFEDGFAKQVDNVPEQLTI